MIRHLLHWADAEYWGQSWPNIFAMNTVTALWTIRCKIVSKESFP